MLIEKDKKGTKKACRPRYSQALTYIPIPFCPASIHCNFVITKFLKYISFLSRFKVKRSFILWQRF